MDAPRSKEDPEHQRRQCREEKAESKCTEDVPKAAIPKRTDSSADQRTQLVVPKHTANLLPPHSESSECKPGTEKALEHTCGCTTNYTIQNSGCPAADARQQESGNSSYKSSCGQQHYRKTSMGFAPSVHELANKWSRYGCSQGHGAENEQGHIKIFWPGLGDHLHHVEVAATKHHGIEKCECKLRPQVSNLSRAARGCLVGIVHANCLHLLVGSYRRPAVWLQATGLRTSS
mmetsp:Transcript_9347/g.22286  ORF Transcript_9347/g.22286 Transcript_9347/m.22286 type:complete len:232 (-) Transcript_9347:669-1364(-)